MFILTKRKQLKMQYNKIYFLHRYAKLIQGFETDSSDEQTEEATEDQDEEIATPPGENYDFDSEEKTKLCD